MSDEKVYHDPHLALNRIYTRGGDSGETSLVGGQRVAKDALRIECYGTVDELNSWIGMARVSSLEHPALAALSAILLRVQHELFNLGSILATLPQDVHPKQPRVTAAETSQLEREIDEMNHVLPSLRSFVSARRLPIKCRVTRGAHGVPPNRADCCGFGAHRDAARSKHTVSKQVERRAFCVEPVGQSHTWRRGSFVGTQSRGFGSSPERGSGLSSMLFR